VIGTSAIIEVKRFCRRGVNMGLPMQDIVVTPRVIVPAEALTLRTARSQGPGGQNVNKVATKVELRVDLSRISGLDDAARARLRRLAARKLDRGGQLVVVSQRTRSQTHNLEDARDKVCALVRASLVVPKRRRPTKPSRAAREARLTEKRRVARQKRERKRGPEE
jgi:ribosome-associated protein